MSNSEVPAADNPPTDPCSVVWSHGRPFVLEAPSGRPRWVGTDTRGRPQALTRAELARRGWSHRRAS
ncbi:hypothetical protein SAMN05421504_101628 [Amycolatopsis xylanica]|uniref:Uncharacterized protein n=1 Tax=Amycolatopsis xylanica TaxID=589385 RepID=A0A1H2TNP2_9PSEU|nr:hypothetical protein SAMN05421504_101628 [Amycolatopsis xylanica]